MRLLFFFFFFKDTATTEIYTTRHTLSLHDALPISRVCSPVPNTVHGLFVNSRPARSEEHTSELQSRLVTSYAVFCLKKKKQKITINNQTNTQHNTQTHNTPPTN